MSSSGPRAGGADWATGRNAPQWLSDGLAEPFGLELHLGLPAEDKDSAAPIFQAPGLLDFDLSQERSEALRDHRQDALLAPSLPMYTGHDHAAELPAGGGMGNVDSMAKVYSLLEPSGHLGGGVVAPHAMEAALRARSEGLDCLNDRPLRLGLGFELADPIGTMDRGEACTGRGWIKASGSRS